LTSLFALFDRQQTGPYALTQTDLCDLARRGKRNPLDKGIGPYVGIDRRVSRRRSVKDVGTRLQLEEARVAHENA